MKNGLNGHGFVGRFVMVCPELGYTRPKGNRMVYSTIVFLYPMTDP